ncbi:MAG: hypothetical protein MUC35_01960 [Candidatus Margulisbacteria bacterium]|jgi:hypothetical protein|nr:hypothetical protein [Candidatus Margulisiibacteriota bacterium]
MIRKWLLGYLVIGILAGGAWAADPYVYNFPKPPTEWGQAVSFGNLSPGFFQVMYQNKTGVVRIATYGIVGASMDNLKDPQLMMVFAFDQKGTQLSQLR